MAKTGSYVAITPSRSRDGGLFEVEHHPEKAAQDLKAGAPVIITAGLVEEAGVGPALIYGFALEDGHNTAADGTKTLMVVPARNQKFHVMLNAAPLAVAHRGGNYGLVEDAGTHLWYLDTADVGDQMTVIGWETGPGGWELGDTNPVVEATVDEANIQHL